MSSAMASSIAALIRGFEKCPHLIAGLSFGTARLHHAVKDFSDVEIDAARSST
jgi:hypothetical protein